MTREWQAGELRFGGIANYAAVERFMLSLPAADADDTFVDVVESLERNGDVWVLTLDRAGVVEIQTSKVTWV